MSCIKGKTVSDNFYVCKIINIGNFKNSNKKIINIGSESSGEVNIDSKIVFVGDETKDIFFGDDADENQKTKSINISGENLNPRYGVAAAIPVVDKLIDALPKVEMSGLASPNKTSLRKLPLIFSPEVV